MKEFYDFLNQNISTIAGLIGVLIGAGTSYLIQIGIGNRQRKWQLQDEKRNLKIEKLNLISNNFREYYRVITLRRGLIEQGLLTNKEIRKFAEEIAEILAKFEYPPDEELAHIIQELFTIKIGGLEVDIEERKKFLENVQRVHQRINYLIDQEY